MNNILKAILIVSVLAFFMVDESVTKCKLTKDCANWTSWMFQDHEVWANWDEDAESYFVDYQGENKNGHGGNILKYIIGGNMKKCFPVADAGKLFSEKKKKRCKYVESQLCCLINVRQIFGCSENVTFWFDHSEASRQYNSIDCIGCKPCNGWLTSVYQYARGKKSGSNKGKTKDVLSCVAAKDGTNKGDVRYLCYCVCECLLDKKCKKYLEEMFKALCFKESKDWFAHAKVVIDNEMGIPVFDTVTSDCKKFTDDPAKCCKLFKIITHKKKCPCDTQDFYMGEATTLEGGD